MDNKTKTRHVLLRLRGRVYRLLPLRHLRHMAPCYRRVYFATRDGYQKFLQPLHYDTYSSHVLSAEVIRWTGYNIDAAQALHKQSVGLYEIAPSGIPRGEKKKLPEKPSAVLTTVSTALDVVPVTSVPKSILQIVTGVDVITDAPLDRWGEGMAALAGMMPSGKLLLKLARKRLNTPPKRSAPKPIGMPQKKVPCFKSEGLPQAKVPEFERQLVGQEKGLNNLSADEYLKGRALYSTARAPGVAKQARVDYQEKLTESLSKQLREGGLSAREADKRAAGMATEKMGTLAALHNPDLVAGGKDVIGDFGDRNVNSSIGAQWKSRVGELDEAVKKIPEAERGKVKVNAKLERCK